MLGPDICSLICVADADIDAVPNADVDADAGADTGADAVADADTNSSDGDCYDSDGDDFNPNDYLNQNEDTGFLISLHFCRVS